MSLRLGRDCTPPCRGHPSKSPDPPSVPLPCQAGARMDDAQLRARERIPVRIYQDAHELSCAVAEEIAGLIRERAAQGAGPCGCATISFPFCPSVPDQCMPWLSAVVAMPGCCMHRVQSLPCLWV